MSELEKLVVVFLVLVGWLAVEIGLYMVHPGWAIVGFGLTLLWIFGANHDRT